MPILNPTPNSTPKAMSNAMLTINIKKQLNELCLDIDLALPLKGIIAVFGRSGAGKTTLINILSGLAQPDSGYIALGEQIYFDKNQNICVPTHKRQIGYVFQDARLFPHYDVLGNLTYGQKSKQKPNNRQKLDEIIEILDIKPLLRRRPAALSGGEKQRVAIGRALLTEPKMLLMDEPLSSLDIPRKNELLIYLNKLAKEIDIPILFVTHGLEEILRLADSMIMINNGKLVAAGDVETVWASPLMRPWLPAKEHSSILKAKILDNHPNYPLTRLALADDIFIWIDKVNENSDKSVRIHFYANDISITKDKASQTSIHNIIPATISELTVNEENNRMEVSLQIGDAHSQQLLLANITLWAAQELQLKLGDKVYAQIKTTRLIKILTNS